MIGGQVLFKSSGFQFLTCKKIEEEPELQLNN